MFRKINFKSNRQKECRRRLLVPASETPLQQRRQGRQEGLSNLNLQTARSQGLPMAVLNPLLEHPEMAAL